MGPPAETLQSDPAATIGLLPAVAATLLSPSDSHELPELKIADSADLRPIRPLGEGAMGRVLLATQGSLDREVAVKSALRADRGAALALILEGVITGKLEHPNIPPVHQLGRDDEGNPVLVMKRIEGARWSELLANRDHPVRESNPLFLRDEASAHLEIIMQVSNALHYAHARGVFHRDVKPDNVMIGPFGEVYLIDWGVAWSDSIHGRVETERTIVGSAAYMAPELVRGERPDARTDVYLLGATLHHVLTGRYRHEGKNSIEAMRSARDSLPFEYGPDVPAELAALCNAATSVRREDRPESALEFVQAIRTYLTHANRSRSRHARPSCSPTRSKSRAPPPSAASRSMRRCDAGPRTPRPKRHAHGCSRSSSNSISARRAPTPRVLSSPSSVPTARPMKNESEPSRPDSTNGSGSNSARATRSARPISRAGSARGSGSSGSWCSSSSRARRTEWSTRSLDSRTASNSSGASRSGS